MVIRIKIMRLKPFGLSSPDILFDLKLKGMIIKCWHQSIHSRWIVVSVDNKATDISKRASLYKARSLAKQAWRLLQNRDSLFYKVFHSKFFHNCSIWEAADTQSSSYAWKSILRGREVLREGMRWRVGTGTSIWVWSDPWLPQPSYLLYLPPSFQNWQERR